MHCALIDLYWKVLTQYLKTSSSDKIDKARLENRYRWMKIRNTIL